MRLFCYKLETDSGFAPNPFFGVMTLATCKPKMRESKKVGDWIAGFTSKEVCGDPVGHERVIYLMQVTEKMPIAGYYTSPRFQSKIPDLNGPQWVQQVGDNIYKPRIPDPTGPADFEQVPNRSHSDFEKETDLSGCFVLISERFWYFGRKAVSIPANVRPEVREGQHPHGYRTWDDWRARQFVDHIRAYFAQGIHGPPHDWPRGDDSWRPG